MQREPLSKRLMAMVAVAGAVVVLGGCDNRTSSGGTVGQAVGQSVDKAIDKTNATVDKAGDKIGDVARTTEEALKSTAGNVKEKAQQVGTVVDDSAITAAIKADLLKDPGLSALKVDVNTVKGEVTLRGEADSAAARERAGRIASTTTGVVSVNNSINVKG